MVSRDTVVELNFVAVFSSVKMTSPLSLVHISKGELYALSPADFVTALRHTFVSYIGRPHITRLRAAEQTFWAITTYAAQEKFPLDSALGKIHQVLRDVDFDDEYDIFDCIEVELADYIEAVDEQGQWDMSSNLSPNLLKLFEKTRKSDLPSIADWTAPSEPGLGNSVRLVETNFQFRNTKLTVDQLLNLKPKEFVEAARDTFSISYGVSNPSRRLFESKLALLSVKSYLQQTDPNDIREFSQLTNVVEAIDENELEEEEDVYEYMDIVGEYLEALDRTDDTDTYNIGDNLSANLLSLFRKDTEVVSSRTYDWAPPTTFGLGNSKPIVKVNKLNNGNLFSEYEVVEFVDETEEDDSDDSDDSDYDEVCLNDLNRLHDAQRVLSLGRRG